MNIRYKKYKYVNMLITLAWLSLVCVILRNPIVVAFSMGILLCVGVFYSASEITSECCIVINLGYILALVLSHWVIMHKVVGIEHYKVVCYIILTWILFYALSYPIMIKINKDCEWLVFKHEYFGLRTNSDDELECSQDKQVWHIHFAIYTVLYVVSAISIVCLDALIHMPWVTIELVFKVEMILLIIMSITFIVLCMFRKVKVVKLSYFNKSLITILLSLIGLLFPNVYLLSICLSIFILFNITQIKKDLSVDKEIRKVFILTDLITLFIALLIAKDYDTGFEILLISGILSIPLCYVSYCLFLNAELENKLWSILDLKGIIGFKEGRDGKYVEIAFKPSLFAGNITLRCICLLFTYLIVHMVCLLVVYIFDLIGNNGFYLLIFIFSVLGIGIIINAIIVFRRKEY